MELQPRDAASGEGIMSPEQMVGGMSETILDKFGEKKFDVEDIGRSLEEAGPYQNVFMQVTTSLSACYGASMRLRIRKREE